MNEKSSCCAVNEQSFMVQQLLFCSDLGNSLTEMGKNHIIDLYVHC